MISTGKYSVLSAIVLITCCVYSLNGAATQKPAPAPVDDIRLKAPWAAAIFQKNADGEWQFLCSGTITGRYTVITSARCVLPRVIGTKYSSRPYHIKYTDLQVVAGLPTADLASKDQYTQFGIVGQIRDVYDPNTSGDTPEGDLASIRLTNLFNLTTPYVKDVQLLEVAGTLMEANETKSGEVLMIAGYENPRDAVGKVKTRANSKGSPLKIHEIAVETTETCINRYTEAYPAYYFNIFCGKSAIKSDIIPCHHEGSGLVKKVKDITGNAEAYYLFGVYSSNSALAKTEGNLATKNSMTASPCTNTDIIFFSRYGHLGRWAVSNNFCDNDLAMCKNDKCRPWIDLCNGKTECDDGSDETEKICFRQNLCTKDQFRCAYGVCLEKVLVCDGFKDCKDGSDEDKNGVCKGRTIPPATNTTTCEGIKPQEAVTAHCSHSDRKGLIPCTENVPLGTTAVLRRKEIIVNCNKDGKWSRSARLTC